MSTIKWHNKACVSKLLVSKYKVPLGKISRQFCLQLIKKMSLNDVKAEIKNLTSKDVPISLEENEVRAWLKNIVSKSK